MLDPKGKAATVLFSRDWPTVAAINRVDESLRRIDEKLERMLELFEWMVTDQDRRNRIELYTKKMYKRDPW